MKKIPLREKLEFFVLRASFRFGSVLRPEWTAERALHYFITTSRIARPGWEAELVKTARRRVLACGLVTYSWGTGPRVLLVHGWDGRGTQMGRIAGAIADAGFEAICVDLPAHGESPGVATHVPEAKDYLLKVGEELGPFQAVIAHSFGACASIYAVYQGLATQRVIYVAGANRFTGIFDRYCEAVGVRGLAKDKFYAKVEALVGIDASKNYPALWAAKLDTSAFIIHDRDDQDAPYSDGLEMHAAWKGSRMLTTEGLGHRRILKSKEVLNAIVTYLTEKKTSVSALETRAAEADHRK